jgi:hypothetical protein
MIFLLPEKQAMEVREERERKEPNEIYNLFN